MMKNFNDFSIMSWNVKGAGSKKGRRHVRNLVQRYRPTLFILLKSHISFGRAVGFWRGYKSMAIVEAHVLEDNKTSICHCIDIYNQMMIVKVEKWNEAWLCRAVYASPIPSLQEHLWQYLVIFYYNINLPWFLIGDFNEVLWKSEVKGGLFQGTIQLCLKGPARVFLDAFRGYG